MSRLSDEVFRNYYTTTAGRGHASSREYYERAAAGLKRRFGRWLPEDRRARCLDLGCGCGEILYLLEQEGFGSTVGVDLCDDELQRARPYVRGELIAKDAVEYLRTCAAQSFDFVSAANLLEHLSKDVLLSLLHEVRRVLRPGGCLVAMVPNALSPLGGTARYWDITHEWAFSSNNFRQLAALTGFETVEFRECGPLPHGIASTIRYGLWQVIRAAIAVRYLIEIGQARGGVYTMDMLVRLRVGRP